MRRFAIACCALMFATATAGAQTPSGQSSVAPPPDAPQVVISTSLGDIVLSLDPQHAPASVANFLRYAKEGHYDGTLVYRVVPGFVIQAGSYDSAAHSRDVHEPIALEANNGLSNLRGSVAMAREDAPNTATAEFFIDLSDNTALDHHADDGANATGYAVFGHVVSGMDVVDKIAGVPLGDNGPMAGAAPVTPVVITKVVISSGASPDSGSK